MNRHFQVVSREDCSGETRSAELIHRRSDTKLKQSAFQIVIDMENGSLLPSVYSIWLSDLSVQQKKVSVNFYSAVC